MASYFGLTSILWSKVTLTCYSNSEVTDDTYLLGLCRLLFYSKLYLFAPEFELSAGMGIPDQDLFYAGIAQTELISDDYS